MLEKLKATWSDFLSESKIAYRKVTAWIISIGGALQYAHDNFVTVQDWMTKSEYHKILGALAFAALVSHILAVAKAKKGAQQ